MKRTVTALTFAALFTLTACGAGPAGAGRPPTAAPAPGSDDVADAAAALDLVGLETGLETGLEAAPAPSASADPKRRHPRLPARRYLRQNTLHGEVTVQGKDGVRTMVVQRGSVTAVDAKSVTVKSTDGFTLTWTLGDKVKVRKDRKPAEIAAVRNGAQVGLAGAEDGTKPVARLVVVG